MVFLTILTLYYFVAAMIALGLLSVSATVAGNSRDETVLFLYSGIASLFLLSIVASMFFFKLIRFY